MLIRVKVHPASRKEKIVGKRKDSFEVFVQAKAEKGDANKAVLSLLARFLSVPRGKLRLIKGGKTPSKIIEIRE